MLVNQGGEMERADSEVDASRGVGDAWYYDAATQRLIIKVAR